MDFVVIRLQDTRLTHALMIDRPRALTAGGQEMAEETIEMGNTTAETMTTGRLTHTDPRFRKAISHSDLTSRPACRTFRRTAILLTTEVRDETDVALLGNLVVDGNRLPIRPNEHLYQAHC